VFSAFVPESSLNFFECTAALPNEIHGVLPAAGRYSVLVAEQAGFFRGEPYRGDYCLTLEASPATLATFTPTKWVE